MTLEERAEEWSRTCFRLIPFNVEEVRKLCKKSYIEGATWAIKDMTAKCGAKAAEAMHKADVEEDYRRWAES